MARNVLHQAVTGFQHNAVLIRLTGLTGATINGTVDHFPHFTELQGPPGVLPGFLAPVLPVPVDLISQAPIFDGKRVLVAVFPPQTGVISVLWSVTVFNPTRCFLHSPCSHIYAKIRLGLQFPAESNKFISTETVRLHTIPS